MRQELLTEFEDAGAIPRDQEHNSILRKRSKRGNRSGHVLPAPSRDHGQGHAVEVAAYGRLGRVVVPVGVQPEKADRIAVQPGQGAQGGVAGTPV